MKVTEKIYYWSGQFIFIPTGAILITAALVVLYFSWPLFNSIVASVWFLLLMAVGSVLISYRRKLTVSKLFLIEESTYLGLFPTTRERLVGDFLCQQIPGAVFLHQYQATVLATSQHLPHALHSQS